jgi:hypothetical protein
MKVLKVLGTVLLGGLLFLSLVFLGLAFTIQNTLLNPNFAVRQADKLDIPALARDIAGEQLGNQTGPQGEFIKNTVYRLMGDQEPWLKRQLDGAIRSGYDYLLGRSDRLSITVPLGELKQNLKEDLWQTLTEDPATWLPLFQDDLNAYIDQHFAALAQQIEPSLPPPLAALPIDALRQPLQDYLRQTEGQIVQGDLSPQAYDLILTVARPYFDDFYDGVVVDIPDLYSIDMETLPADAVSGLQQARQYVGYFRTGFYLLIVFALLLAGGIVLINRRVRTACLALGIVLTAGGAVDLAGFLVAGNTIPPDLLAGAPASLGLVVNNLIRDMLSVGRIFAIGVLAAGVILLALSILYWRRNALE